MKNISLQHLPIRRVKNSTKNQGFSLIEVLVSVVVLSIGLMGLSGLQIASLKGTNDAHFRTQASLLIMDLSERLRVNQAGVIAGTYSTTDTAGNQQSINCASAATEQCGTTACSGEELAKFDKHAIACGVKKALPNGKLTVTCISNDCAASVLTDPDATLNKTHKIVVSWHKTKAHNEDRSDGKEYKERTVELDIIP